MVTSAGPIAGQRLGRSVRVPRGAPDLVGDLQPHPHRLSGILLTQVTHASPAGTGSKSHCSPAPNRAHRSCLAPPDSRCRALLEPQLALIIIIIICCRQGLADRRLRLPTDAAAFALVPTSRVPTPMSLLFSASCNVASVHLTTRG